MTAPISSRTSTFGGFHDDVYYSDGSGYGAIVDAILEYVSELSWPTAGDVYARMRNDGQIAGSLRAITLPIRRAGWALDGEGCKVTVTRQIADDLGLPVLGQDPRPTGARRRKVVWSEHLRVALLDAVFGHMPFEQTYDLSSGTARLVRLQERMPKTIQKIFVTGDGDIDYVEQAPRFGQSEPPKIKRNALVWYCNEREGLGWRGRSMMRASFPYWLIKDEMLRVHATSNRRFGMGVPYLEDQPNATPQQHLENARYAQTLQAGQSAGASIPNGARLHLAGIVGSVPDTLAFIKYLDTQMSVSFLTQWMNLGMSDSGNRALAEIFVDVFMQCVQDFGDQHADQATSQIVVPLVDANWGEDEPAPRIVCGNVGANRAVTAAAINELYTCGALSSDPVIENHIRALYKFPPRDPTAAPAPAPDNPPPNGGTA